MTGTAAASPSNFKPQQSPYECSNTVDDWGPCTADSSTHDWYFQGLGPKMTTASFDTLYNSYDTLNPVITHAGSHTGTVDVVYLFDSDNPIITDPSTTAIYTCITRRGLDLRDCDHAHITYNDELLGSLDYLSLHPPRLKSLACHETGHSFGLTHGADGDPPLANNADVIKCLQVPSPDDYLTDDAYGEPLLGAHNAAHIQNWYPTP